MISRWENNKAIPINTFLATYSKQFNIDLNYLLGVNLNKSNYNDENNIINLDDFNIKKVKLKKLPLLGDIACGKPIFAVENNDNYIMVDEDIRADFCLNCKGDSMINVNIYDGDIVYVKNQSYIDNGDIAVVIIDDEATLKRFYYHKEFNLVELKAENPKYEPLLYKNDQLDHIRVLGRAIGVYKKN